jgi:hypothetical protein
MVDTLQEDLHAFLCTEKTVGNLISLVIMITLVNIITLFIIVTWGLSNQLSTRVGESSVKTSSSSQTGGGHSTDANVIDLGC